MCDKRRIEILAKSILMSKTAHFKRAGLLCCNYCNETCCDIEEKDIEHDINCPVLIAHEILTKKEV